MNDPKQAFAVADVAMLNKDLDNAEAAYKKALSFPVRQKERKEDWMK